jgi:hypothetical protein
VANRDDAPLDVGYCKPPAHTKFVKGQSGNPRGRPKGSQNLATLLAKAGRQRIRVTENGRTRHITKFEALMLQLINKAVSGDLKAIGELFGWIKSFADPDQGPITPAIQHENDEVVMANILARIRNSENVPTEDTSNIAPPDSNGGDK